MPSVGKPLPRMENCEDGYAEMRGYYDGPSSTANTLSNIHCSSSKCKAMCDESSDCNSYQYNIIHHKCTLIDWEFLQLKEEDNDFILCTKGNCST